MYISTLFTWTWAETVKTINFYRETLFNSIGKCFVGGILATLMPDELFDATGIQPVEGLLNDPSKVEQEDDVIIDSLPPDYEILRKVEIGEFKYSNTNAYLGYTTRGCVRHCEFCAVGTLEPKFMPYIDITSTVNCIIKASGEKQNLVLMDNNVLASSKFGRIIDDIKSMGFVKGAVFGKTKRRRCVDFNQGLDARLLTEEKMAKLAEIPLEPMRLAFDSVNEKETYINAVELAHRYGQRNMSNYILYNFHDSPEDFWERLSINADLNGRYKGDGGVPTAIYSFPMRFIPLNAQTRRVGTCNNGWNKRYLRSVQAILNVMKGLVMPGKEFFLQAFGRSAEEFVAIALMPDAFIENRLVPEWRKTQSWEERLAPYVRDWMHTYWNLSEGERETLIKILGPNDRELMKIEFEKPEVSERIRRLLQFHLREETIVEEYKANRTN